MEKNLMNYFSQALCFHVSPHHQREWEYKEFFLTAQGDFIFPSPLDQRGAKVRERDVELVESPKQTQ